MTVRVLGIETSCDETAASVVEDGVRVASNVIATQHDLHETYAGVVPEIASRAHLERILPVIRQALAEADTTLDGLDAIAVGHRPGLIGSLLVGVSAAKALAWALDLPVLGVDHVAAHLYAGQLESPPVAYPALGLVVSGGHTSLFDVADPLRMTVIGRTIDDAIGEAYDKAATMLDLGYPGGPLVDALAATGNDRAHRFPVANLGADRLDFSFSGLKTSLLYAVRGQPRGRGAAATFERDASALDASEKADFAASFQRAAVRAIVRNVRRALDTREVRTLLVGGGVSANSRLRSELTELAVEAGLDLRLPRMEYCLDNAAMIAGLGTVRLRAGERDDWSLAASPNSLVAS
ncbi:MAG: tRNA (adenosine(37)-N6)-threonylcarbamoyltransferase complex transferase subunit TsaD [Phycisphaerales bacterium]|nr:tRNA (adenosine(37)-N6)-threonylcarbamoyltransferase complex transferase subunit TsaD [Phycisphaerales bacterium]